MVLVQIYLTANSQYVDLNLPPRQYRVKWVGCQQQYSAADSVIFSLQYQSTFTMQKYGNVRYSQTSFPNGHHSQIQGDIEWVVEYSGAFLMEVYDLSTSALATGTHFTQTVLYYDVECLDENLKIY